MHEAVFHFNVPDKLVYACRLLRKAYMRGVRVLVTGEEPVLARLDQLLWTFSAHEFVPHCRSQSPHLTRLATPVWLASAIPEDWQSGDDVLLNLGASVPQGFERFARCIEVVTAAVDDRAAARQRWKYYSNQGISIGRHDVVVAP